MDNLIKLSATVVSHTGMVKAESQDNFYINGRFMYEYESNNVQVSIENNEAQYIFAVCDGMVKEVPQKNTSVSVIKELRKLHEKIKNSSKDIGVKLDQLKESIEETNNLIYSISLGSGDESRRRTAFAGLIIAENKAAAVSIGNCRAFLLRGNSIKQLPSDYKKTERLLRMGIITSQQAEALAGQFGSNGEEDKTTVKKSEIFDIRYGDVFLLCSNGLTDMVEDEKIFEILSSGHDTDYISNLLIKEALKNGGEDSVTALIIKIDNADGGAVEKSIDRKHYVKGHRRSQLNTPSKSSNGAMNRVIRIVTVLAVCILIAGAAFGVYKLMNNSPDDDVAGNAPIASTGEAPIYTDGESADADLEITTGEPQPTGESSDSTQTETDSGAIQPESYTVKAGDNLYMISKKFYNDREKYVLIMKANDISDPNKIIIGQVLVIPRD